MVHDGRHPWMQTLNIAAICPKCNEPELRRSHARSFYERMIKDHTLKRPFRCHACGWRGWCDETALTFPITPEKLQAVRTISADDSIPEFTLDDAQAPRVGVAEPIPSPALRQLPPDAPPSKEVNPPAPASDLSATGGDVFLPSSGSSIPPQMRREVELPQTGRLETEGYLSVQRVDDHFHDDERHRSVACPRCATFSLHRSHSRDLGERMRKLVSRNRPYRCHACGWRGWVKKD